MKNMIIGKLKESVDVLTQLMELIDLLPDQIDYPVDQSKSELYDKYENNLFVVRYIPSFAQKGQKPWSVETRSQKGVLGKRKFGGYDTRDEGKDYADQLSEFFAKIGVTETPKRGRQKSLKSVRTIRQEKETK